MATLIHILSKTSKTIRVAAYYTIPDNLYDDSSLDLGRTALSNKLTPAEMALIKQGKLFELTMDINVTGMTEAQVKQHLETRYPQGQPVAEKRYRKLYSDYVGEAWDGSAWG